jgi:hypothetical protein
MNITLSNDVLDAIDTARVDYVHPQMQQWFHLPSGREHYRLLIYLTNCFNNIKIADIGTYRGASATALAQNKSNQVFSLDVGVFKEKIPLKNINFCVGDFHTDKNIQDNILASSFIFLDIDHLYNNEIWLYQFLTKNNWTGIMLCDDIYLNDEMRRFWDELSHPKQDITKYGHGSGTGFVNFNSDITLELK